MGTDCKAMALVCEYAHGASKLPLDFTFATVLQQIIALPWLAVH